MTPEAWWRRRAGCAKVLMAGSVANGMGRLDQRGAAPGGGFAGCAGASGFAGESDACLSHWHRDGGARRVCAGSWLRHRIPAHRLVDFRDFPAMDDARVRRGAACVHVVHGEAVATLAALALINRGYVTACGRGFIRRIPNAAGMAGEWVDARLGVAGVLGGQAYDLSGWRGGQTAADVSAVAARKTGDLLRLDAGFAGDRGPGDTKGDPYVRPAGIAQGAGLSGGG